MTYEVSIKETLQRSICVEAEDEQTALDIVDSMIENGEIVLSADDFVDRKYAVSSLCDIRVVKPEHKHTWVRRILSTELNENITLQLSHNMFLWVERYIENNVDTLPIEINEGHTEDFNGERIAVFGDSREAYKLDLNDIKTTVDTLLEVLDYYVKPIVKPSDIVAGAIGLVAATGILSVFSVLMALI